MKGVIPASCDAEGTSAFGVTYCRPTWQAGIQWDAPNAFGEWESSWIPCDTYSILSESVILKLTRPFFFTFKIYDTKNRL
jgi:hypothetical protein